MAIDPLAGLVGIATLVIVVAGGLMVRYERRAPITVTWTRERLSQLTTGASREYLQKMLGEPISRDGGVIYATPYALVGVPGGAADIDAFYVTVTDPSVQFNTGTITGDRIVGIWLGRDRFSALPPPDERRGSVGASGHYWAYWEAFEGFGYNRFVSYVFGNSMLGAGGIWRRARTRRRERAGFRSVEWTSS